jgi:mono/diheme cytochrome c family protein
VSVLALTSGQKAGILVVALVFIAFALLSAFVLPRRNPDFPGRRVGLFSLVSVGLFVAMLTAMVVFAQESEEEAHEAVATEFETGQGATEPTPTDTAGGETEPPPAAEGNAEAGEAVFASSGCGSCHTLSAADGATGTIGPNLDEAQPDHALVVDRVTNGAGAMPSFQDSLSEEQIQDVAAYVVASTSG